MMPATKGLSSPLSILLLSGSLAGLTGCLTGCFFGGDEDADSGGPGPFTRTIGAYTVSGDSLFTVHPSHTQKWCNGNELETDTSPSFVDTSTYTVEGNTLTLYDAPEEHMDWDTFTGTGIFIQTYTVATRVAGGPGLPGTWKFKSTGYRVSSGTLTAEVKEEWDDRMAIQKKFQAYGTSEVTFKDGTSSVTASIRWAEVFVAGWKGEFDQDGFPSESSTYDATVTLVDAKTAKIKGNQTGEVVTVTFSPEGDRAYSSDKAGRAPYVDGADPVSCPVEEWYYESFLAGNLKVDQPLKRGARPQAKRGSYGGFPPISAFGT